MRTMNALPPLLEQHLGEIRALCEKYRVKRLAVFGSAVKGTFDPQKSDVDFVVEFEWHNDPLVRGRRYIDLWSSLKRLLDRDVDLVVDHTIENPYFRQVIDLTQRDVY